MLTDRGVGPELADGDLHTGWLAGCDWLHIPSYGFAREPIRGAALAAATAARRAGGRLSVDLSSTAMIEAHGADRFRELLTALRPDVVFGTAAEAALVDAALDDRLVVKLGADGVLVAGRQYPAKPAVAVDATGAGDAFAAGYLVGGVELGLAAAARAVAKMGAMP